MYKKIYIIPVTEGTIRLQSAPLNIAFVENLQISHTRHNTVSSSYNLHRLHRSSRFNKNLMILWVKHQASMLRNLNLLFSLSSSLQHPVCGHRGLHQPGVTVHGAGVGEAAQRALWKVRRARHSESLHTLLSHHGSLTPRWARVTAG